MAGTGAERRYGLAAHREGAAEVRLKPTESIAGAEGRLAIASLHFIGIVGGSSEGSGSGQPHSVNRSGASTRLSSAAPLPD